MTAIKEQKILLDVIAVVESTLRYPPGKLDVDTNFEDIGVDSIIAMELMNNLSKKFNISMSPASFTNASTLKELADLLSEMVSDNKVDEDDSPDADTDTPGEELPTEKRIETNYTGGNRPVQRSRRTSNGRAGRESYQKLFHYINEKYNVDLSYRSFGSIDEIVDTLVTDHADDLLLRFDTSDPEAIGIENSNEKKDLSAMNGTSVQLKQTDDIAIVGISCNFPDAPNSQLFWDNLLNEKVSFREIPETRWDWKTYYADTMTSDKSISKWGALIEDVDRFDAQFFNITAEEAAMMDPQERLLLQEVYKAFQDGGIDPVKLKGSKTGVFVSYEYQEYEHYLRNNMDRLKMTGPDRPFFSSSSPSYYLANRLSFVFDFNGPSESVNVNCAGSAVAINRAYYSLLNQESDVAVVGGASLNLFANDYIALSKLGMLSPDGTCAVFDDNANGFTRGEGVASVILKRLDDAEKDNNKIYGVIKYSHQNNRGNAKFLSEIKVDPFTNVISDCYKKASIAPETIRYIEVDGYATKWGDSFEFEGIRNVFEKSKTSEKNCALGSVKGNIGNLESVSGLASFIKLALSLYNKKFPATVSKKQTNTFIDIENTAHPLYIAESPVSFEQIRENSNSPVRAGINSFADSGVNVHILLEEFNKNGSGNSDEQSTSPQLFVLSAKDRNRLMKCVQDYIDYVPEAEEGTFVNMIYTLQTGREDMDERLAIIVSTYNELLEKLNLVKHALNQEKPALEEKGIFYGNTKQANTPLLFDFFPKEMAEMLFRESLQKGQWQKIAQLWITGFDVPWGAVWTEKGVQPVSLPLYPFYRERYWMDSDDNDDSTAVIKETGNENIKNAAEDQDKEEFPEQAEWFFFMGKGDAGNGSMNPLEKISLFLRQEIALILQKPIREIDPELNFLYSGMDSIQIGTFLSKTIDLLGIKISPGIIFNHPDIKKLSEYLCTTYPEEIKSLSVTKDKEQIKTSGDLTRSSAVQNGTESVQSGDVLFPLQTSGKKRPFFAVSPGGNGATLGFNHLVQALGTEQPFYGIELVGLEGEAPVPGGVEEIARVNIDAVRKIQAKGPYRLLGFSNGGMIAFEMARILLDEGEKIELLALLDSFSPVQPVIDVVDEIVGVFKGKFSMPDAKEPDLSADQLRKIPENERFDYLYDIIKEYGLTIPKKQFASTYNIALAMDSYCREYKPSKLTQRINVLLFRAKEGYMEGYEDLPDDYGWNQLLTRPARICHIDADHFSMTDEKPSQQIAKKIGSVLDRSSKSRKKN